ncbi:MAG TPA: GSCFA domain-containing protein [Hanamia sp.]|nr:GSCFA domain-containing protein [Hanamia sp.]
MEFFLQFKIRDYPFKISYQDKILFIGSCFSEEIGYKLKELKLDILQNPNGILYDPLSISDSLFSYIENKSFDEKNLFQLNGLWHSWKHHSSFSGTDKTEVLNKIYESQLHAHAFLKQAKFLIITLGTAFNYQLKINNENVANCHKAPTDYFEKKLIPTNEIISEILSILTAVEIFNPDLKIVFTVSPVKHIRDGVVENNRSKARLIEVSHSVCDQKQNVFYFPSYELVTDILRDYRFYKSDLVHPNETAVNYVFEKFCDSFFSDDSRKIMKEIKKIITAINHKPFLKHSEAHQKFITGELKKIQEIEKDYPFLDLSKEKRYFTEQIANA